MIVAYIAFFGVILWYWFKLLRWMIRLGLIARKAHKQGLFRNSPPRGRIGGYFPEAVVLGEAEAIERGITNIGHHATGLDSLDPL